MNDKMRAEFEAALTKHMPNANLRFDGENYSSAWANAAWWGWQASRAALVIELPEKVSQYNTDENGFVNPAAEEYDEAIDDCRIAIEAAGVRVKT